MKDLEKTDSPVLQIKLLEELIGSAHAYKDDIIKKSHEKATKKINIGEIKLEKISEEIFLYKPVTVKNYYDGDYLERFANIRTSNLKDIGALDMHNKFWKAHEVVAGNIFATIPQALLDSQQSAKLEFLQWDIAQVDIYEIPPTVESRLTRSEIMKGIAEMFQHYILLREVFGNILMVLHYKL